VGISSSGTKNIARGLKPRLMKLDNEASQLLKDYVYDKTSVSSWYHNIGITAMHQNMQFSHLSAGLCSTDNTFPMHLWYRLLSQSVITFNMLRTSIINPKLSA
jgi:hypothetical protein